MVQNMDPRMRSELMSKPGASHIDHHPLDAGSQMKLMSTLLKDATAAEARAKLISDLVEDRSTSVLTFLLAGYASMVSAAGTSLDGSIPINVSQAESTIANNTKIPPFEWTIHKYLGC